MKKGRSTFLIGNLGAELFSKFVSKILCDNKIILQFDNDPKHKSLHANELYQENNIKTIDWPSDTSDLNPIENILEYHCSTY